MTSHIISIPSCLFAKVTHRNAPLIHTSRRQSRRCLEADTPQASVRERLIRSPEAQEETRTEDAVQDSLCSI